MLSLFIWQHYAKTNFFSVFYLLSNFKLCQASDEKRKKKRDGNQMETNNREYVKQKLRSACVDAANGIRLSMIVQREFILFHLNALTQVDSESFLKFKQIAFEVLPKELLHSSSSSGHSFACALLVLHITKFFLFVFFFVEYLLNARGLDHCNGS